MPTLTIEIPEKVEKTLSELIQQLGGKVIATNPGDKNKRTVNIEKSKLSAKDKEFLKGFEEAIEFVNLHQQGKVKAKTIDELLNEL